MRISRWGADALGKVDRYVAPGKTEVYLLGRVRGLGGKVNSFALLMATIFVTHGMIGLCAMLETMEAASFEYAAVVYLLFLLSWNYGRYHGIMGEFFMRRGGGGSI